MSRKSIWIYVLWTVFIAVIMLLCFAGWKSLDLNRKGPVASISLDPPRPAPEPAPLSESEDMSSQPANAVSPGSFDEALSSAGNVRPENGGPETVRVPDRVREEKTGSTQTLQKPSASRKTVAAPDEQGKPAAISFSSPNPLPSPAPSRVERAEVAAPPPQERSLPEMTQSRSEPELQNEVSEAEKARRALRDIRPR